MLCAGAVSAAVFALATLLPNTVFDFVFCRMPAGLAAAYFGAASDGSAFVLADGRIVAVTRACGGAGFFAMVCGLLTWRITETARWRFAPVAVVAAWGYAMLVNGVRVVATVWARSASEVLLPERLWGAVHLATGVAVFFSALMVAGGIATRVPLAGRAHSNNTEV